MPAVRAGRVVEAFAALYLAVGRLYQRCVDSADEAKASEDLYELKEADRHAGEAAQRFSEALALCCARCHDPLPTGLTGLVRSEKASGNG
jgi:hypothetical protein